MVLPPLYVSFSYFLLEKLTRHNGYIEKDANSVRLAKVLIIKDFSNTLADVNPHGYRILMGSVRH